MEKTVIDVVLLRVLKSRKDFNAIYGMIPKDTLELKTKAIIEDFRRYFTEYPSHDKIDWNTFIPQFKRWHNGIKEDVFQQYVAVFRNVIPDADEDQRKNLISDLAEIEMVTRIGNLTEEHMAGDVENVWGELTQIMDQYRARTGMKVQSYCQTDIGELLKQEFDESGIQWRLDLLNSGMRGLRPGDFGIVAGRPDKGKTTFLTSEMSHMLAQLPEGRNLIWLNNESLGERIRLRFWQSAVGLTTPQMAELHSKNMLVDLYEEKTKKPLNALRIFDIHGYNTSQVEAILQDNNPGIVIYDMIDNVRGFGDAARTDLALEKMYQWAREKCVLYDCIGIGTSQISNEGDNLQYPSMGMLKDSKTGKQGACDFQIMIGAVDDPYMQMSRFLGVVKNKLRKPDGPSQVKGEVIFDANTARYKDIPMNKV